MLEAWKIERSAWLREHPEPWPAQVEKEYHLKFSWRLDQALDAGHGGCVLRTPVVAELVAESLAFFEDDRYRQFSWVVMPNHVHVLFAPLGTSSLQDILHSWKSFTSKAINKRLGRNGKLWQEDYFDRLIRDGNHFANCARYIRRNPLRAKLKEGEFVLWESSLARSIE